MIALGMLATVHAWHGDEAETVALAERAVALGERRRIPLPAVYAKHALSLLAVAGEDAEAAIERLEVVRGEALPGNVLWTPHLVDAYVRAGRDATELVEFYARSIEHRRIAPAMLERLRGMTAADGEPHFKRASSCTRPDRRRSSSPARTSRTASGCGRRTAASRRAR